jgi:hypothetical protein
VCEIVTVVILHQLRGVSQSLRSALEVMRRRYGLQLPVADSEPAGDGSTIVPIHELVVLRVLKSEREQFLFPAVYGCTRQYVTATVKVDCYKSNPRSGSLSASLTAMKSPVFLALFASLLLGPLSVVADGDYDATVYQGIGCRGAVDDSADGNVS